MLFGDPSKFAIEVAAEADSALPAFVGKSLAGRFRLYLAGESIGRFEEPCCVLAPIADHFVQMCVAVSFLWHSSFNGLSDEQLFELLDGALFLGEINVFPEQFHRMSFLTNVSECLDGLKGFLVSPEPGLLKALVRVQATQKLVSAQFSVHELCSAASGFEKWVQKHEAGGNDRDA